ncbi:hypothetical protein KJ934_01450, partial [Patescibacteria group bacterium]|nr:hypothetical protein [Patescibacteria group bacterium]
MLNKKNAIILILILVMAGIAGYFFFFQKEKSIECLGEKRDVFYKIEEKESPLADVVIAIDDKSTKEELFSFKIENIRKNYHPIELHQCGIYVIRMFNYDPNKVEQKPDYKSELWRYSYTGNGESVLLFHEIISQDKYKSYYVTDFRIDSFEKYLVLEKGYLGKEDYSLVVKDLNTKKDVFTLLSKDLQRMNPNFIGVFDMLEWSEDGRYFWGSVSDGAYVNGYFRIDTQNWKADIYEAPDGAMGGSPLNINTGYLPVQPGQVWTGDYQLTEELKEQYKKEGKKSQLYLYNLFT